MGPLAPADASRPFLYGAVTRVRCPEVCCLRAYDRPSLTVCSAPPSVRLQACWGCAGQPTYVHRPSLTACSAPPSARLQACWGCAVQPRRQCPRAPVVACELSSIARRSDLLQPPLSPPPAPLRLFPEFVLWRTHLSPCGGPRPFPFLAFSLCGGSPPSPHPPFDSAARPQKEFHPICGKAPVNPSGEA